MNLEEEISGDVYIGGGETHLMREIAKIALSLQEEHPDIRYHLHSGNAEDVSERLDKGLLDFGIVSDPADIRKYDFMRIPGHNIWGLLMPKDHPLAERQAVSPKDLEGVPLIISRQNLVPGALSTWLGKNIDTMKVVGTYNLIFNAALMVEQGLGCAIAFDQLVDTMAVNSLCFRPLTPRLEMGMNLVWKKYQLFSPAAEAFLNKVQETFQS